MLAAAISLLFALSACFAVFAIVHTVRSQTASVVRLLEEARGVRTERSFAVRYAGVEAPVTTAAGLPRPRLAARGAISRMPIATRQPLRAAA
ncbi:MAG: hypothetical protein KGL48_01955 [Sphingomonadales bacterium]|nr:hypothetical protein [Sphingomonadales bacterium]MDE2569901.1 hypothetical protein [Sphingomonadales bacterium]